MHKILSLYVIIVISISSGCTNAVDNKTQEIQQQRHDSTPVKKKGMDTLGMKMGGNELNSKKK
jgi:protein involved in sex pheromone biosynthesis